MFRMSLGWADKIKLKAISRSWRLAGAVNFTVRAKLNGNDFRIPVQNRMGYWLADEAYLNNTFASSFSVLQYYLQHREGSVVDIGTNVGAFCLFTNCIDRARQYIGFEINIRAATYVQDLIDSNTFENSSVFPLGLNSENSVFRLHFNSNHDVQATLLADVRGAGFYKNSRPVITQIGDDLLEAIAPQDIAFIKIDVEGAEASVIKGIKTSLEKHQPAVLFEVLSVWEPDIRAKIKSSNPEDADKQVAAIRESRIQQITEIENIFYELGYSLYKLKVDGSLVQCETLKNEEAQNPKEQDFLAVPLSDKNWASNLAQT